MPAAHLGAILEAVEYRRDDVHHPAVPGARHLLPRQPCLLQGELGTEGRLGNGKSGDRRSI